MKRLFRVLSGTLFALLLTGCSTAHTVSFTWFVDKIPTNLDPQLAQTSAEIIACNHLYTGLYQKDESGVPQPGCASGYTLSEDGLRYTFTIRPDLYYHTARGDTSAYAITAEDFVFAFQRIFRPETNSPYVTSFAGIAGGMDVFQGTKPESELAVTAPDSHTLVIQLNSPDPSFLEKLTLPGAMPCDEEYFESTDGTYGLTKKTSLSNGRFYLYNWTEGGLFLRRKASGNAVNSLRIVTNSNPPDVTPVQLVSNERCTAAIDLSTEPTDLQQILYSNTTWSLLFGKSTIFDNTDLRQALSASAQNVPLPNNETLYGITHGLVPDGAQVDTLNYRAQAGDTLAQLGDGQDAWQRALQQVQIKDLKGLTLLVPESADKTYVQCLNGSWQKDYGLFFNIETVDAETFARRIQSGDFNIALAPIPMTVSDPTALLSSFAPLIPDTMMSAYLELTAAANSTTGSPKIDALAQIEHYLADNAIVTPLYRQNARLLLASSMHGVQFDPFGPLIDVSWAYQDE